GVMFGNPETTTGGNALKFYASVRMDIRRIGAIKQGDEVIGSRTKVKIVKNKVAPPFREAEFDILYGKGISRDGEIVDLGADAGIIEKSGSWYAFDGERIGQGRENAKDFLRDHQDVAEKVEAKIRVKFGVPARGGQRAAAAAAAAGAAPTAATNGNAPANGAAAAANGGSSAAGASPAGANAGLGAGKPSAASVAVPPSAASANRGGVARK